MSRTTTALKRLGVPTLAAATMIAGLPLFLGTAQAAHVGAPIFTAVDGSDSAAAGSCQAYYIDLPPTSTTADTVGEDINVILTDETGVLPAANTSNADFCTLPSEDAITNKTVTPQAGTVVRSGGAQTGGGSVDESRFATTAKGTTGADARTGRAIVGITRNQPGNVTAFAYYDANDNNQFNAGEPNASKVVGFTAGGPAGSNTNQNAAQYVEVIEQDEATRPAPKPAPTTDTDTAVEGEVRTFSVFVGNGAPGDQLNGVTVSFQIASNSTTAGATRAAGVFGVTNNEGIATGTITFPARSESASTVDTVTFFVNQTAGTAASFESAAGEPSDTVAVTVIDGAGQQNRSITLSPENRNVEIATGTLSATFTAVVDDTRTSGADTSTATLLSFAVSGGDGDETVTVSNQTPGGDANECTTTDNTATAAPNDNDSSCVVTVTDPSPKVGQVLTVTATVRGTSVSDSSTVTETNKARDARNIDLTPNEATTAPNTARTFTARVTDSQGNPVQGVGVTFTETGAGAFRNGSSNAFGVTDANGQTSAEVISLPGELGTQSIRAEITSFDTDKDGFVDFGRGSGTTDDACEQAAGEGTSPTGTAVPKSTTAGNCSDTSTNTFTANGSPSATSTATQSPPPGCTTAQGNLPVRFLAPSAKINRNGQTGPTVNATALVTVSVPGATPGATVELQAYQQNHFGTANFANAGNTRTAIADANGVATFQVRFSSNARARAKQQGCAFGANAGFNQGGTGVNSNVLYVRTVITFSVTRVGTRTVAIQGDSIPARPGGLIVNIHCTDARCSSATNPNGILFQVRANQTNGEFGPVRYRFAESFQNDRVILYAATGVQETGEGDAQNVAGRSNNRNLLVF